ncbi:MAG: hypothetical protein ACK45A_10215, partial [Planctomyces sp.]
MSVVSWGRLSLALREALAGRRGFSHGLSRIMAVVFATDEHGFTRMNRRGSGVFSFPLSLVC